MRHQFQVFQRYAATHGTRAALRAVYSKLTKGRIDGAPVIDAPAPQSAGASPKPSGLSAKTDVIGFYMDMLGRPHGTERELADADPADTTLQWVIPNFGYGSGGHLNIFRFINNLADLGFQQRLVILPPHNWSDAKKAQDAIAKWYFPLKAEVALGVEGFAPSHATIATGWQTAYWVAKYQATRDRFYFVQDFEPAFYATSSEYFFAENTYRLGLKGITAGTWLAEKLAADYGMKTGAVSFSCEMDFYKPAERQDDKNFNILFYSRHVTKRRLFEMGLCALDILCRKHPEVAVIFAGGDVSGFRIPFHHLNAGELSLAELPALYAQCDLSLVLSGTNLSLLPLELAACKCPIVMNDTPSSRWLLPDEAAYYAPMDPEAMAEVMSRAVQDHAGRQKKADAAYELVQQTSWVKEAEKMARYMKEL